jgi:serpin B
MNKNHITISLISIIVLSLGIFLSGCIRQPTPIPDNNSITPENSTINNYTASGVILNNVVDANNQFAFDLYSKYESKEGNMFFSPYSISSALAMTYEGAKGKTAAEMQSVLHLSNDKATIHSGFADINTGLNKADKSYQLSVANALWAQKDYPFKQDYFDTVNTYYGGKVANLDFVKETEKSRVTINTWVENNTNDRIKDLIPKGLITNDTRLVLTNAIYFKANWTNKFDAKDTSDEQFKLGSGDKITTSMMYQTTFFNYSENDETQMLEMDYLGNDLSMLIILPKEDNLSQVESGLTIDELNTLKKDMKTYNVKVTLPKFKFETKYFMKQDLIDMGMPTAFDGSQADFTGMWTRQNNENLYISQVIHQTFIEVAENGTEAAAATAVIIMETSSVQIEQEPVVVFNADHPFMFIIQEKATGNILFMGRLSDPR